MALYDYLDKYTPQYLLKSALSLISNTVDKREGSVIFDTIAPLSTAVSYLLGILKICLLQTDVETATGDFLDLIASENGIYRLSALAAQKIIQVTPSYIMLDIGTTMRSDSGLGLIWEVSEVESDGCYVVICQTVGAEGGGDYGELTLVETIDGIKSIQFVESIFDGKDAETDGDLRVRFWQKLASQSYGGNFDNYKEWCLVNFQTSIGIALDGIQMYPASRYLGGGNILIRPTTTEGNDLYMPASSEVALQLKAYLDPIDHEGLGAGLVPVGHRVTVQSINRSVKNLYITVKNYGLPITEAQIFEVKTDLRSEFNSIRKGLVSAKNDGFPDNGYSSTIYKNNIITAIDGNRNRFETVVAVMVNGEPIVDETIICDAFSVAYMPVLGSVTIEAVG